MLRNLAFACVLMIALVGGAGRASAHPHVFVTAAIEIRFDPTGKLIGVDESFTFDDMFSSFSTQGLDTDGDGRLSRAELAPLATTNITAMKAFGYYTYASHDKEWREFEDPKDYWLEDKDGLLVLHFFLAARQPEPVHGQLFVDIRDPTIFVAFTMADQDPVRVTGLPADCRLDPARTDPAAGPAQFNRTTISCGTDLPPPATVSAAPAPAPPPGPLDKLLGGRGLQVQ